MTNQPNTQELQFFFDIVNRLAMFEAEQRLIGRGLFRNQDLPMPAVAACMQWLDHLINNPQQVSVPQYVQPIPVTGEVKQRAKPGPKPKPKPPVAGQPYYGTTEVATAPAPSPIMVAPPHNQTSEEIDQAPLLPPEDPTFITQVKPGAPFDYSEEVKGQVLILPDEQR